MVRQSHAWLVAVVTGGLLLGGCAGWTRREHEGFSVAPQAALLYGDVDGFAQIPRGGQPGTTSAKRPTFDELGIGAVPMADVSLAGAYSDHALYAGARIVEASGSSVLDQPLESHGTAFPQGTALDSGLQLNWYRAGYRYRLAFANDDGMELAVEPIAELALLAFSYDLHGAGASTSRAFSKGTARLGIGSSLDFGNGIALSGGLTGSLPIDATPTIFSIFSAVDGRVWGRPGCEAKLSLGIAYDRLEYQDNQPVPNHVQADIGPSLLFGVSGDWSPSCSTPEDQPSP